MSKFSDAYDTIAEALRNDKDLFYSYQADIAMAFKDQCAAKGISFPDLHDIANTAARDFLRNWICKSEIEKEKEDNHVS